MDTPPPGYLKCLGAISIFDESGCVKNGYVLFSKVNGYFEATVTALNRF